jgi:hypothetical protein
VIFSNFNTKLLNAAKFLNGESFQLVDRFHKRIEEIRFLSKPSLGKVMVAGPNPAENGINIVKQLD